MMANRVHFFGLKGVELQGEQEQDSGEDLEVVLVPPAELDAMMQRGDIHNAMTVTALGLARQAGLL
jgi:hypothetical protein